MTRVPTSSVLNRLLEMMVSSLTIDLDQDNSRVVPSTYFKPAAVNKSPAVYHSYQPWGRGMYGMTLPHPTYAQLLTDSSHFVFSSNMVPMILPPRPWVNQSNGEWSCVCPKCYVLNLLAVFLGLDEILVFTPSDFSTLLCLTHIFIFNELLWGINVFVWKNAVY